MPKQSQELRTLAINYLLLGHSIKEVAEKVNVSEKTIDNWLKDDSFKAILKGETDKILDATVRRLISLHDKSLIVLDDILENSSDRNRLHAVKMILELSERFYMRKDLIEKVETLETKLNEVL